MITLLASLLLANPASDRAEDVAELTRIKEIDWNGYYRNRDAEGLVAFLHDDFVHFMSDGAMEGKADAVAYVRENDWPGAENGFAFKVTDIDFYGPDTANVYGVGSFDAPDCRMNYVSSNILKRTDGRWQAIFSHSSPSFCPATEEEANAMTSDELDVQTAVSNVYAAISGPVGAPRDWDALRAWTTPDVRFTPIGPGGHQAFSLDGYIERSEQILVDNGFHEMETGRRIEIYGKLAHVWSAYEGRQESYEGKILVRGINSFQLAKGEDGRWRVFSILWQPETPDLPVPADLTNPSSQGEE